jgi:protein O-mannosyl-transferase
VSIVNQTKKRNPSTGTLVLGFSERRQWFWGLALIALVVVAYWRVFSAGFIWDDDMHLTRNPCVVGPLGLNEIWTSTRAYYYPFVLTTFWFLHKFVGLNPWPYHVLNVLVHAGSAVLLWRALRQLKIPGAWLGAALWALHPVMVESVAWVTELKNTQSCLFYLASILCFLKWEESPSKEGPSKKHPRRPSSERRSLRLFALSLMFFALATFSKPSVVVLPAVLALCIWWRRRRITLANMVSLAPFAAISAIASVWTIWEQRFHSGAVGPDWAQTWPERFMIAGHATWFYLSKLAWPHPLIFIYPRWEIHSADLTGYLALLGALAGFIALWLVRADWSRAVFFAAAYYVISLFPVLGFFSVYFFRYSFVGDHFQYLASMGPLALAGAGITLVASRRGVTSAISPARRTTKRRHRSVAATVGTSTLTRQSFLGVLIGSVLLVWLGFLTWQQSATYHDLETLWRTTIDKNPRCWLAENNLGELLDARGDLNGAVPHFEKSLQLAPDHVEPHCNLGQALARQGQVDAAMAEARIVLNLDPNSADAHGLLGIVLLTKGLPNEAIAEFSQALEIRPDHKKAHYNLALALLDNHQTGEAIAHYEKAIEADPDYIEALTNLAWIFATSTNAELRNGPRAVELAEKANRLTAGTNPLVLRTLAAAYANNQSFPQALEMSHRALELAQEQHNPGAIEGIRREMSVFESARPYRAQ